MKKTNLREYIDFPYTEEYFSCINVIVMIIRHNKKKSFRKEAIHCTIVDYEYISIALNDIVRRFI